MEMRGTSSVLKSWMIMAGLCFAGFWAVPFPVSKTESGLLGIWNLARGTGSYLLPIASTTLLGAFSIGLGQVAQLSLERLWKRARQRSSSDSGCSTNAELANHVPGRLIIVACVFLTLGSLGALKTLVAFMHGRLAINLDILGIGICFGLLAYSAGWRVVAIIYTVMMMGIWALAWGAVGGRVWTSSELSYFAEVTEHPATRMVVHIGIGGWILFVLFREDVRKRFKCERNRSPSKVP